MLLPALCIISKPSMNLNLSYSPETLNSGHNRRLFVPCDLEIWRMTFKNNMAPLLCYFKLCASSKAIGQFKLELSPETLNSGQNRRFFVPCGLGIWRMTFKNNRAPLIWQCKLCVSFCNNWWNQTGVTVRKPPKLGQNRRFFSHVTLKFDGWPRITIGHLS